MKIFSSLACLVFLQSAGLQSAFAHRDLSNINQERQEIKQSMLQRLSAIKEILNSKLIDAKALTEQTLYLNKAAEFSAELFPEISPNSSQFSKMYRQLISQTSIAYQLSLKNNDAQLLAQIQLIDKTCNSCHLTFKNK